MAPGNSAALMGRSRGREALGGPRVAASWEINELAPLFIREERGEAEITSFIRSVDKGWKESSQAPGCDAVGLGWVAGGIRGGLKQLWR